MPDPRRVASGQAPAREQLTRFVDEQLYGSRNRRANAVSLAGLRAGGRFGAAANFTTAAKPANQPEGKAGKRKRNEPVVQSATASYLDRAAAKLMKR
jgi:hypothetical protein